MKKIKDLLLQEHSRKQAMKIVRFVGDDQKRFDELISFCFNGEEKLAQRASWPVALCGEEHPEFLKYHFKNILRLLKTPCHNAIRRNFIKMMVDVKIPTSLHAEIISICFDLLNKKGEFVAIKVFSMSLIGNFCKIYPELEDELKASIEAQLLFETAAFRSRAKKVLVKINRMKYISK